MRIKARAVGMIFMVKVMWMSIAVVEIESDGQGSEDEDWWLSQEYRNES